MSGPALLADGARCAPSSGQDPSLRCKGYRGGNGKAAGRACPAPTDCRKKVVDERGEGGRQPGPFSRAEVAREWAATHSPSESPSPLTRPAPFDKGAFFLRGRSPREEPPHQGRWPRSRPEGSRKLAGGCPLTGGNVRPVGTLQASQARPAPLMGSLLRAVARGIMRPLNAAGVRGNTRI